MRIWLRSIRLFVQRFIQTVSLLLTFKMTSDKSIFTSCTLLIFLPTHFELIHDRRCFSYTFSLSSYPYPYPALYKIQMARLRIFFSRRQITCTKKIINKTHKWRENFRREQKQKMGRWYEKTYHKLSNSSFPRTYLHRQRRNYRRTCGTAQNENEKEANVSKLIEVLIPIQTHIKWVVLVNGKSLVKYGSIHTLVRRTDFVAFFLPDSKNKLT